MVKPVFVFFALFTSFSALGQTLSDSLELELLEFEMQLENDSAFLINLLETIEDIESLNSSQLALRFSYSSDVSSAGRDFGINQSGFSPTVSYYHKSGSFAEVGGNIFSDLDPKYSFTTLTGGYSGLLGKRWSYLASYDHFFYNEDDDAIEAFDSDSIGFELEDPNDLTNSINLSAYYDLKPFTFGIDYSFLFGSETAHRIIPSVLAEVKLPELWGLDRVSLSPSFSVVAGNQTIIDQFFNRGAFADEAREVLSNLSRERRLEFIAEAAGIEDLTFLQFFRNFTQEERNAILTRAITLASAELLDPFLFFETIQENRFTILNYALSLPLRISVKDFDFISSYIYNFPQELEGEPETPSYGYFRFSVAYSFGL